jgi:ABC-2 type transport system ATP-binding protein
MTAAVVATGLGKRYRHRWGLRDCTLQIPQGRVAALVGPNGAGKTTLLHLATGLSRPTAGTVRVLGRTPDRDIRLLADIGFVAQDVPLYRSFTVGELLEFGRHTNPRWDHQLALARLARVGIDLGQRAGTLSGGQRAQVALTLALAKRPRLLLLDEPLASLDPLARREFLQALMEAVTDGGLTVVLSSHLIADLERVCDHLIVLSASRTQVTGDIDQLLASHRILTGPRREAVAGGAGVAGVATVVQHTHTERQSTLLVRTNGPIVDPTWSVQELGLEELVLAYLGQPNTTALPPPRLAHTTAEESR